MFADDMSLEQVYVLAASHPSRVATVTVIHDVFVPWVAANDAVQCAAVDPIVRPLRIIRAGTLVGMPAMHEAEAMANFMSRIDAGVRVCGVAGPIGGKYGGVKPGEGRDGEVRVDGPAGLNVIIVASGLVLEAPARFEGFHRQRAG